MQSPLGFYDFPFDFNLFFFLLMLLHSWDAQYLRLSHLLHLLRSFYFPFF